MKTTFSEDEVKGAIGENERQAEKILEDEEKTQKILSKAKRLLAKLREAPVIGKIVDDIADTIEMIKDAIAGRYTIPTRIIVSALGGILYIISPIDIIPDFIPIAGWLDDAAVFTLLLETGLALELNKYRKWKRLDEIVDDYKKDVGDDFYDNGEEDDLE